MLFPNTMTCFFWPRSYPLKTPFLKSLFTWDYFEQSSLDVFVTWCFWLWSNSWFKIPFLTLSLLDVFTNNHHLFFLITVLPSVQDPVSWGLSLHWKLFSIIITWCFWLRPSSLSKIPFLTLSSFVVISKHHHLSFWLQSYPLFKTPYLNSLVTWYCFQ